MSAAPDVPKSADWLQAGDRQAFERFYLTHASRLLSFLRRSVADSRAAEDIAHEAFMELWLRRNGFDPARGSARAYLFGIAARRAADWWRRAQLKTPPQPSAAIDEGPAVVIADALERLAPDERSLLWLREVEGYSYQELAGMLAIPLGTVRSRLHAARRNFRRVWKGEAIAEDV